MSRLVASTIGAILIFLISPAGSLAVPVTGPVRQEMTPMSDTEFWAIINSTTAHEADPDLQLQALQDALADLSAERILGFRDAFERQMQRAYRWDLWGVDYIAHGGASDDSFEYFRRWLISKGQATFERVLADPDSLAEVLAADSEGVLEFEEISYVADEVWAEKTGLSADDMPPPASWTMPGAEPSGERFDEAPDALAARFPRTWARFGETPLA